MKIKDNQRIHRFIKDLLSSPIPQGEHQNLDKVGCSIGGRGRGNVGIDGECVQEEEGRGEAGSASFHPPSSGKGTPLP